MLKCRNYGIDLLRIISMIMIVFFHIFNKGGIIEFSDIFSINYEIAWLLYIFCYCAVDCFAIVSGYVMCNSKIKFSNLIELWFQVFFYSVVITLGLKMFTNYLVGLGDCVYSFFPVMFNRYWYFTAYFGMFLFLPFLNKWISNLEKKEMKRFLIVGGIFICILPILMQRDPFKLEWGYSSLWLTFMYIVGAYIKRFINIENIKKWKVLIVYFVTVLFLWINKFIVDYSILSVFPDAGEHGSAFIQYNSIFIVICAVSLFLFFLKLNIRSKSFIKFIEFMSPISFGAYLIHDNGMISKLFIEDKFVYFIDNNFFVFFIKTIIVVFMIYCICSLIDCLRLWVFRKMRIKQLSKKIDLFIQRLSFKIN